MNETQAKLMPPLGTSCVWRKGPSAGGPAPKATPSPNANP